jgi:hypothetical protein
VKKANTEGLPIQGEQQTQVFSSEFIDEALILSDLFHMNEYAAVELLMAGKGSCDQGDKRRGHVTRETRTNRTNPYLPILLFVLDAIGNTHIFWGA